MGERKLAGLAALVALASLRQRSAPLGGTHTEWQASIMADPAKKRATYEDVLAAPPHMVAEIIDGELDLQPRPAFPHAVAASALGEELGPPFKRGKGGPGGWMILYEPEVHLGADILVPDLAGWRRERMPETPTTAFTELAPDWVAEVLSPSTYAKDRGRKLAVYAREGVRHVWLVEPAARVLEVLRLDGGSYRIIATLEGDAEVRAEPFDAIELDRAALWAR
jgi:Uma2 family endonuclease